MRESVCVFVCLEVTKRWSEGLLGLVVGVALGDLLNWKITASESRANG